MSDAISRRTQAHPSNIIDQALKILDDKNLKISFEDRMAMVEPLLQAKFFGKGGKRPPQQAPDKNNPQGQTMIPPPQKNTGGMNG